MDLFDEHQHSTALGLLLGTAAVPLTLALYGLRHRVDRVRQAVRDGDRGAISIELALAIIILVAVAGGVTLALSGLAKNVTSKIPSDAGTAG